MLSIMDNPFKSISILYRKSHTWLNNSCAQYRLSAAQAGIILIVCDFQSLTQDDITKRLSLDKSVIAKTVNWKNGDLSVAPLMSETRELSTFSRRKRPGMLIRMLEIKLIAVSNI